MVNEDMRICAVVVTCHPELRLLAEMLSALESQVADILVVDNGSNTVVVDWLSDQHSSGRIQLSSLGENLGIASAQNHGILRALELGCSHVLLLDQDSIPAADMVAQLLAAEKSCTDRGELVGAVGPRFIDPVTGAETWFHGRGLLRFRYLKCSGVTADPVVRADLLIAAGMLIRGEVFADVGVMDEALFIDLVDSEWCLRAAAAGYRIFGACAAAMYHSIGSRSVTTPGETGRRGTFPVHTPIRYYYMARNSMLLTFRPCIPLWWKLNNCMELLFLFLLLLVTADRRLESLANLLRGALDGIRGRTGQARLP